MTRKIKAEARPARGLIQARVAPAVAEEVRNAVYALSGPPHCYTLRQLVEEALASKLSRLRKQHGKPFPQRPKALRRGRR